MNLAAVSWANSMPTRLGSTVKTGRIHYIDDDRPVAPSRMTLCGLTVGRYPFGEALRRVDCMRCLARAAQEGIEL